MFTEIMIGVGILGGYLLTSLLCFKYPHLLHRNPKRNFKKCRNIAHRGGAGENLENTMMAFRHAVDVGSEMLEIDVHLTNDNEVVVSHDNNLLRTTGVDKEITKTSSSDLPELLPELPVNFDKDNICTGNGDRKIPTLRELFEEFPNIPINIDIKDNDDRLIEEVNNLIVKYKREHLCVWGNFHSVVVDKCYKKNPNVGLLFSIKQCAKLALLTYSGLLPFVPIKETHFEVFLPLSLYRNAHEFVKTNNALHFGVWAFKKILLRRYIIEHLQKRGILVYLWVLNTDEEFQEAMQLGVDGIMTDYPSRLASFLQSNQAFNNSQSPVTS